MSQIKRAFAVTAAAAVLAAGALTTASTAAEAASGGRVCLVLAPNSVDVDGSGGSDLSGTSAGPSETAARPGHMAPPRATPASPRPPSSRPVPGTGCSTTSRPGIASNKRYVKYRCLNTPSANVAKAQRAARTSASNGYNLARNNCLTKSVDIFHAYSPWLNNSRHLPDPKPYGVSLTPNHYYNNLLPKAGWSGTVNL